MEKEKIKGLLPDGSYKEIAEAIGVSYGIVSQYFSGQDVRMSVDTELKIIEEADKIVDEKIKGFINEKRVQALQRKEAA